MPPTYGHVQRTPFSPGLLKKVAVDWDQAKDSNDIFKFRGSVPEVSQIKLETPRKETKKTSGDLPPPPPRFDPYIYQSIALASGFRIYSF